MVRERQESDSLRWLTNKNIKVKKYGSKKTVSKDNMLGVQKGELFCKKIQKNGGEEIGNAKILQGLQKTYFT